MPMLAMASQAVDSCTQKKHTRLHVYLSIIINGLKSVRFIGRC
jgi:hypothetical protein